MFADILNPLFQRDLERLKNEVEAYSQESRLWLKAHQIPNAAGNLCLHLCGNLNAFIGAELGKTGYLRHRELEFSRSDVPRQELIEQITATAAMVNTVLTSLPASLVNEPFPAPVTGTPTTGAFLTHLAVHLGYHLGQVNYHRRLLDN